MEVDANSLQADQFGGINRANLVAIRQLFPIEETRTDLLHMHLILPKLNANVI